MFCDRSSIYNGSKIIVINTYNSRKVGRINENIFHVRIIFKKDSNLFWNSLYDIFLWFSLKNTLLYITSVYCEHAILLEFEVKSQKQWPPSKIQNAKSLIKWQNQKLKHIKGMDNYCHAPDLVQAFSSVKWSVEPGFIASYTSHLELVIIFWVYPYFQNCI